MPKMSLPVPPAVAAPRTDVRTFLRAASRPQVGGVNQSKVPLNSSVGIADLTGWRSDAGAAPTRQTGQKTGDLLVRALRP